jgi:hypothetical protein
MNGNFSSGTVLLLFLVQSRNVLMRILAQKLTYVGVSHFVSLSLLHTHTTFTFLHYVRDMTNWHVIYPHRTLCEVLGIRRGECRDYSLQSDRNILIRDNLRMNNLMKKPTGEEICYLSLLDF